MSLVLPAAPRADRAPRGAGREGVGLWIDRLIKLAWVALGVLIMLAGILISPLPGPLGLPVFVAGLILVLKASWWAKRQFIRLQRSRPNWVFPVRRLLRRRPEFAPVFWQQILRLERLMLGKGKRGLGAFRRRHRARSAAAA